MKAQKKQASLLRWISMRVVALALISQATVLGISVAVNIYWEDRLADMLPAQARAEMLRLEDEVYGNAAPNAEQIARLRDFYIRHRIVDQYIRIGAMAGSHFWWKYSGWTLLSLIPVLLGCLWLSRHLSRQLGAVAEAAGEIARGGFGSRARALKGAPPAMKVLTDDFNQMAERLQRYDHELQVSSAALAHELRTPLTAAKGRLQGVRDGVFPASSEQLGIIMRQLDQIDHLIDDLYLLSLASAGQLALSPGDFYLRGLVEERCAWQAQAVEKAGLRIELDVPDELMIHADRDRVGQVLSGLLDNALRYAGSGRWLRFAAAEHEGWAVLDIEDAGPGFPEQDLDRVCDRFWRAEHSRSRHRGGSGLGLAVAAAICQAHGGSLQVANRPQGGGRVRIRLPVR
ncbi:MAG: ATP-binding protein [Lautropia sp.]|nr:ATP-binding protein [Lautropia sp.]